MFLRTTFFLSKCINRRIICRLKVTEGFSCSDQFKAGSFWGFGENNPREKPRASIPTLLLFLLSLLLLLVVVVVGVVVSYSFARPTHNTSLSLD